MSPREVFLLEGLILKPEGLKDLKRYFLYREREIKGWKREKKIGLIESMNPKWVYLYNGLKGDPSALRPQDDPSLYEKTPRGVN